MKKILIGLVALIAFTANASELIERNKLVRSIYWSDGDSGHIAFFDGQTIKFRLADVDAPETGGVGAAIGGAKCEKERELGFETKEYMVELTRNSEVRVFFDEGQDRYDRHVLILAIDNEPLADSGLFSGKLKWWPHKNNKALAPKPDWCS